MCNKLIKDYIQKEFNIKNPMSVTLTSHRSHDKQILDDILLSRDITFFLNRLNYKIYKKGFTRYGKRLGCLTVIEGDGITKNYHTHLTLEKPDHMSDLEYKSLIFNCWKKTVFGQSNLKFGIKINPVIDEGWLGYQLKNRTKQDNVCSSIDWVNSNNSISE